MKFGFKGHLTRLKLNRGEISRTFEKNMEVQMRNAAREWLRAVYIRVPVWTGQARGALAFAKGRSGDSAGLFLASYLRVSIPIGPSRTADGKPLEVRSGKDAESGGSKSRFTFSSSKGHFRFMFNTAVEYMAYNDVISAETPLNGWPRPWLAFPAGEEAFRAYLAANARKAVPNLKDFVTKTRVEIN